MEYYLAIKRNISESVVVRQITLEPLIQSEISQKEKNKYCTLMHTYIVLMNLAENRLLDTVGEGEGGMNF